ncbi:MAG: SPOR domain-containing protein [Candidatus Neomarinimicrobiota bacterium]|nr:SPOR domain-containing protein [Candidatus Neomarinimicrobiota bacterium]
MRYFRQYFPLFLGSALLISSCEKPSSHYGTVGNYYSVQVEQPVGVENPSYAWDILSFPDESLLTFTDLYIRRGGREIAFQPDVPGNYQFELIVFNQEGKAAVITQYQFMISDSPKATVSVQPSPEVKESVAIPEKVVTGVVVPKPEPEPKKVVTEVSKPAKRPAPKPPAPPRSDMIKSAGKRFTIQIYSEPSLREAEEKTNYLISLGFDAYIQKAYFDDSDKLWYRVRIGAYDSKSDALKAAAEINQNIGVVSWVDRVRVDQ